ncbi:7319_t:CDS:2, partial [Acaulospora colombiana]
MDSRKRKREQYGESSNSTKRVHLSLLKRYQRVRDIPEILSDGANLETGHFCGTLQAVEFENQISTLRIQDRSRMVLICDILTKSPIYSLNMKIQKQIQVAVRNPKKIPMKEHKASQYDQKLQFDEYQFLLGGELFEDTKGEPRLPTPNSSESEPSAPEIPQHDEHITRSQPNQAIKGGNIEAISTPISNEEYNTILSTPRPSTWTPIKETLESDLRNKKIDIAGVPTDWGMMVFLRDETCSDSESLEVKLYATDRAHLPPLQDESHRGAILLIHGLKASIDKRRNNSAVGFKGQWTYACYSNSNEAFVEFGDEATPEIRGQYRLLVPDNTALAGLRRLHYLSRIGFQQSEQVPSQYVGGCQLIEEFRDGGFYHCVVE